MIDNDLLPTGDDSPPCPVCARFTQADVDLLVSAAAEWADVSPPALAAFDLAARIARCIGVEPPENYSLTPPT